MSTVDYKPLAASGSANVVTQAAYLILLGPGGALQDGYQAGTAQSDEMNKTFRQTSMAAAALATAVSDILGVDVLDDGDLAGLVAKIKAAFTASAFTTGDGKLTLKNVADSGWVLCNDGTIGNAGSGATTRANADTLSLYSLLWNNISQTYATVSTGRGATPALDFAALKTITLTKQLGRALIIAGAGAGLTARALGEMLGVEDTVLPLHNHAINDPGHDHSAVVLGGLNDAGASSPATTGSGVTGTNVTGITIQNSGVSAVGKNMQPSAAWNVMIKL